MPAGSTSLQRICTCVVCSTITPYWREFEVDTSLQLDSHHPCISMCPRLKWREAPRRTRRRPYVGDPSQPSFEDALRASGAGFLPRLRDWVRERRYGRLLPAMKLQLVTGE